MSRTRTRFSPGMVLALAILIVIGLIAYFASGPRRAPAADAAPAGLKNPPTLIAADAPKVDPQVNPKIDAPTTAPATRPAAARAVVESNVSPLVSARSKLDGGDLLSARQILNTALLSGRLTATDADACKEMLGEINKTLIFSPTKFPDDEFGGTYQVQSGEVMQKIAHAHVVTSDLLCRLNGISDPRKMRAGQTLKVVTGPFHAVVTKHDFTIEIWLGEPYEPESYYITRFKVGLGADNSTPTGKWLVAPGNKLKNPTYHSPRGEGVIEADDPKNPLGEYWLGLKGLDGQAVGKTSYGIHGTIEPQSIGKMESHGCIRMLNEEVAMVYELLVDGKSTVTIRE